MQIIATELLMPFGVDNTLVLYRKSKGAKRFNYHGEWVRLVPHKGHISLLKAKKKRGYTIIVWSKNGYAWAAEVVRVLKLEKYVDIVMSKFNGYVDDMDVETWAGNRIFVEEK